MKQENKKKQSNENRNGFGCKNNYTSREQPRQNVKTKGNRPVGS